MSLADRLDPLITERAPWIAEPGAKSALARKALHRLLSYPRTVQMAEYLSPMDARTLMQKAARMIARDVQVSGLSNIPSSGPALIVANHPTGIADGLVLTRLLTALRPDTFFYANADILRVLPQLDSIVAPVEGRPEQRSHAKTRATMAFTRTAFEEGRLGVIFPSGRLAKRRWLTLHERPWMASAAMIARKFDLDIIPVNLSARNSPLFYAFDLIHPTLRDITLFHETLNKGREPYRVTVGKPIRAAELSACSEEAIEQLREATLSLAPPPHLGPRRLARWRLPRKLRALHARLVQ
jgi:putative hemolysin